jgi:hypothetical protein
MFVAGAMAATWAAIAMNVPADVARAPDGATNTTTGTCAFRNSASILYVESMSPPGVSMVNTTAAAPLPSAPRITRST